MDHDEVVPAFDLLLNAILNTVEGLNKQGAEALRQGDYESAEAFIREARDVAGLSGDVAALKAKWLQLPGSPAPGHARLKKERLVDDIRPLVDEVIRDFKQPYHPDILDQAFLAIENSPLISPIGSASANAVASTSKASCSLKRAA